MGLSPHTQHPSPLLYPVIMKKNLEHPRVLPKGKIRLDKIVERPALVSGLTQLVVCRSS